MMNLKPVTKRHVANGPNGDNGDPVTEAVYQPTQMSIHLNDLDIDAGTMESKRSAPIALPSVTKKNVSNTNTKTATVSMNAMPVPGLNGPRGAIVNQNVKKDSKFDDEKEPTHAKTNQSRVTHARMTFPSTAIPASTNTTSVIKLINVSVPTSAIGSNFVSFARATANTATEEKRDPSGIESGEIISMSTNQSSKQSMVLQLNITIIKSLLLLL